MTVISICQFLGGDTVIWIKNRQYSVFQSGVDKPAGAAGAARRQFYVTQAGRAQNEILKNYILYFG